MRILHVITSLSRLAGGPARSVQGLSSALCAAGVDSWIWPVNGGEPWVEGARACDGGINGFDIVHIHGLWSPSLHRVAAECHASGIPYVMAPRGMLEPWSLRQKWLKKRIARLLYQDSDLRHAAALHATAESEAEQFRRLGFRNPVVVSPNGVNAPPVAAGHGRLAHGRHRALFMSRMHPKKGVVELLEAWAEAKRRNPAATEGWSCELAYTVKGDAELAYERRARARAAELGVVAADSDRDAPGADFIFTGPLDDDEKWNAYGRADLFVLPTYSENFGIVVAEALYAGVPAITTKGAPWECLEERRCGWWIDLPPKESLAAALESAMSLSDEARAAMGARGRALAEERFSWRSAVAPVIEEYRRILEGRGSWRGRG